ncbi:CDP-diacylglycerol--glycerol-3-phosphate 3-phosphatidyltransferase [Picosynechococcus sp. PCC 7003]|uniref:CDP-diacylglycerol--glycerol-3-phosphate 3-phosphatidyltransferase n=1 Tax=Picosynechococcus sp. PCC 7003 TaxID=374981 RepID=UPI000810E222|nr:CDP-diacylglycerol--glycerol-3-phosphate 3-phosphatidyltransferase [Picosynechococcus sp. PCC 7003]ANV83837.1 CDP-diacylglycerol--glycerol-3-phosphate 3-phosphatidyltransferase [Picosynechococcus sp. PCC 7003]
MNLPTWITVSRLAGVPFLLLLLENPTPRLRLIALVIFLVVALTDWLDGYLARKLDQVTDLGKFLDPLVDKLLVTAPLLSLVHLQQIPAWGVFLILARELTIAGWRVTGEKKIQGANLWGKAKTVTQIAAIALLIYPITTQGETLALGLFWLAVALTVISGVIYLLPQTPDRTQEEPSK